MIDLVNRLDRDRIFRWSVVVLLFASAFAIRATNFQESRMLAEVQFRSALVARSFYFRMSDDIPEWRKEINTYSVDRLPGKEPHVMPFLAAVLYKVTGGERLWVGKLVAAVAWLLGGLFLFLLLSELVSFGPALIATGYFLFVPFGVHASTSFISDPLMIALFIVALYAIWRYYEQPSRKRLITSSICAGLAILVKPLVIFAILSVFIFMAIGRAGAWKRALGVDEMLFIGITVALGTIYYFYGIVLDRSIAQQAEVSFVPALLTYPSYWRGWLLTATGAVGIGPLVLSLLGLPLVPKGRARDLVLGLGVGYAVFCLAFAYHIRFTQHYHLQLIVLISLAGAPVIGIVTRHLTNVVRGWLWWAPALAALTLISYFSLGAISRHFASSAPYEEEAIARDVGEIVRHSSRVVYIARYYGRPLEYLAELSGNFWPRRRGDIDRVLGGGTEKSVEERLSSIGFDPEYFVITSLPEFNRYHDDLQEFLESRCELLARSEGYLVYHACAGDRGGER